MTADWTTLVFSVAVLVLGYLTYKGWSGTRTSSAVLLIEKAVDAFSDGKLTSEEFAELVALLNKVIKGE